MAIIGSVGVLLTTMILIRIYLTKTPQESDSGLVANSARLILILEWVYSTFSKFPAPTIAFLAF